MRGRNSWSIFPLLEVGHGVGPLETHAVQFVKKLLTRENECYLVNCAQGCKSRALCSDPHSATVIFWVSNLPALSCFPPTV